MPAARAASRPSRSTRSCSAGSSCSPAAAGWPPRSPPARRPRAPRAAPPRPPPASRPAPAPDGRSPTGRTRERVRPVAEHGDAQRLQALERRPDVEQRLHARAHDDDRRARERRQVGRLVEADVRLAMHAAQAAGGEHADARRAPPGAPSRPRSSPRRRRAPSPARGRGRCTSPPPHPPATTSSAASSSPIRTSPATTATVAGTAPPARTAASSSRATPRLRGRGSPCAIRVLSSATIACAVLVSLGDLGSDVHAQRIVRAITTRWISLVPS